MTEPRHTESARGDAQRSTPTPLAAHWLVQLALILGCLGMVAWTWDGSHRYAANLINNLGGDTQILSLGGGTGMPRSLTPEQQFFLHGDVTRPTRHGQQRAIWEAHPESRIYLGNYVTTLAAAATEDLSLEDLRRELGAARQLEPENARFDYLEAARLLRTAVEIRGEKVGQDPRGKAKTEYSMEVRNRAQLDEAMGLVRQGLGKPYWRRYSAEMLKEQLAVLGPPRRYVDLLRRTAVAASTLLPDLAQFKTLSRSSRLYAELLITEGKAEEAAPFLEAWQTLGRQVTEDSFTLIDVLVACAILKEAEDTMPPLYRRLGREAEAERVAATAATLAAPVSEWRERRNQAREAETRSPDQQAGETAMTQRAGILAGMLLPALGQWPEAQEYEASRMLEYTVITEFVMAVTLAALLVVMLGCGLIALRWTWWRPPGIAAPPVLLPDGKTALQILIMGILLPLAAFWCITHWLLESGHQYSIRVSLPKLFAEWGLLAVAVGTLPAFFTVRYVRRRAAQLGITVTRGRDRYITWPFAAAGFGLLIIAWCLPVSSHPTARQLANFGLGLVGFAVAATLLIGLVVGLIGQPQYGTYYGAVSRALVTVLALSIVVLSFLTRPVLLETEARYLERDTLMQDRDRVGFTRLENELVEQLRTSTLDRFASVEPVSR